MQQGQFFVFKHTKGCASCDKAQGVLNNLFGGEGGSDAACFVKPVTHFQREGYSFLFLPSDHEACSPKHPQSSFTKNDNQFETKEDQNPIPLILHAAK